MSSDMSSLTRARSSSKRNSASARASSGLPTPVGPRERNEPTGRRGAGGAAGGGGAGLGEGGGGKEEERARGGLGVGESGAGAAHGVGDAPEGFVLPHHAPPQALFHVDELFDFAFEQPAHRDAGPLGDEAGDVLFVH